MTDPDIARIAARFGLALPVPVGRPFPARVPLSVQPEDPKFPHAANPVMRYAVDYDAAPGTPVCAIRPGTVVYVKADSDRYGYEQTYADDANMVCLDHGGGLYSEYIHLAKGRVFCTLGTRFHAGEVIAETGLSGCMSDAHLHLNVFVIADGVPYSVPFTLQD
jgi:murein DD-endopeptidase MepM/ murein hydrolase activator NlpD